MSFDVVEQRLLEPDADPLCWLLAAAAVGLMPDSQPSANLTDRGARCGFLARHLQCRDYEIETAREHDLPALLHLEQMCWEPALRTEEAVLRERILRNSEGQLVMRVNGTVVGVVYSQGVEGAEALEGIAAAGVDLLLKPGASTIQLLAVNVLPEMQHRHLGDQLLEFMLIYCSLQPHVRSVIAVTRCKSFHRASGTTLVDYIHARNARGVLADPILRFHELHGATIEKLMPGYRPADVDNEGCGVLVSYDILHRRRTDLAMNVEAPQAPTRFPKSRAELRDEIRQAIVASLGPCRQSAFDADRPLMEMGLDSADLLDLGESMSRRYGVVLAAAFFFEFNTPAKIDDYLAARIKPLAAQPSGQHSNEHAAAVRRRLSPVEEQGSFGRDDVAIVGMACRLPGGIETPDALWQCLASGTSVIGSLPADRWTWPDDIDPAGRHVGIDRGGFLDEIAAFDAPIFRISPTEAGSMDPQQRILLELCWQAIEHAGYAPTTLSGSQAGVFIGASGSDYARLMEQAGCPVEAHHGTGSAMAVLANRVSYFYDLQGPSLVLDTACSSSLVAVHEAVRSIQAEESTQALVGGINLILHPANSIAYYKAGMLSKDGVCRTFDAVANGYVRSEGAVVMLLKPLRQAVANGDRIHAVIRGTACNHGGQASGLTVPHPGQQARLLQTAWSSARIDPGSLTYIEAHGTGTPLGDPIEVRGITLAFAEAGRPDPSQQAPRCGLGSVKSNLGHLEAAAGIAGLLKVVLCLQHRQLPASLHFRTLNEQIPLAESGMHVVDRHQPWLQTAEDEPRIAGVSSFGSGGTNAHVVVAEYPAPPGTADGEDDGEPVLFVLSARTRLQLATYARRYVDWLGSEGSVGVSLRDIAWQGQSGRPALEERLALVVRDRQELLDRLARFSDQPESDSPVHQFSSKALPAELHGLTHGGAGQVFIRSLVAQGDLDRIAWLWLSGVDVDWSLLRSDVNGAARPVRRVALPTYPFARHRYWLPQSPNVSAEAEPDAALSESVETEPLQPTLLAPTWHPVAMEAGAPASLSGRAPRRRLVIGASRQTLASIRSTFGDTLSLDIDPASTIEALRAQLRDFGDLDEVVWVASCQDDAPRLDGTLIDAQHAGLRYVFKLVKALAGLSTAERPLILTAITFRTQMLCHDDTSGPAHAGVHGLTGALARQFPRWTVRSLDLDAEQDMPAAFLAQVPGDGDVRAYRNGQWMRRFFAPVQVPGAMPAYRQNGVYVVIGGAGGIGTAWTRHVVEHCAAQVIWIGRRGLDRDLRDRIAAIAKFGPAPVYVAADAADLSSLQTAFATIRQEWPVIHGVIHAAVGIFDRSLIDTDEARFQEILSVKIDASVHLAEVLRDEPLDFLLFFSSIVSLEKNGGLEGYAAGGAFEDAFALALAYQQKRTVKVVNWGHWDIGTGAAISDATKRRRLKSGHAALQPDEAFAALQTVLRGPLAQVCVVKTTRLDALDFVDATRVLRLDPRPVSRCIDRIPTAGVDLPEQGERLQPLSLFNNAVLEARLLPLLAGTLQALGLLDEASGGTEMYRQWLAASRKFLDERLLDVSATDDLAESWRRWEVAKSAELAPVDLQAAVGLAETCLRALPDILSGAIRATDVLFPGASMRLVEGIYRGNAVADHFNRILSEALVAAIEIRLQQEPDAHFRILEIGAGTGGTTATVLPHLAPYRNRIAEYAYTDVSKAFLFHAEEQFVDAHPFVRPMLFDVENPLAGQSVEAQAYDFVIATNVLHATRDVRSTLANVKATLRGNGLLLLNEISTRSLFAHLTFGLLEGWWLARDTPLRMPASPCLTPQTWRDVLRQAGFAAVMFPVPEARHLGQQVIVAESDGLVLAPQASPQSAGIASTPGLPRNDAQTIGVGQPDGGQGLREACSRHLKTLVAKVLRMRADDIDVYETLGAYGLDSILVVQITEALRAWFPDVGSTLLFEAHTIDALSERLLRTHRAQVHHLTGLRERTAELRSASAQAGNAAVRGSANGDGAGHIEDAPSRVKTDVPGCVDDAIAVIGMSCRFPKAGNIDAYWRLLASGQSGIGEVPEERWPIEGFFHGDPDEAVRLGRSYSKWGGFLEGVTEFDPLFFNISPKEAATIDPQERLFLQVAWQALEDAGYTTERIARDFQRQLGVFVGITRTGFDLFGPPLWQQGETVYPHTSFSSVANRLSFFLDARGPSVPVDTMCSSSLTAVHQACQSLRSGECRIAIAGGVNIYLHPSGYIGLSAMGMLSKDGVCRSFGKGANGFVPGEGVAALLLKPLAQAIADEDRIYATLRATQVNHGGRTNGYTVPNPQAQADLVRDALLKGGVDARTVSYVEAHGTGTELGDPIEVAGLTQAFRHFTADNSFCALGSAKSTIGHLEAAAGVAGLIKVILQMQYGQIAPSLHAEDINPNIDFDSTPFVLQRTLAEWPRPCLSIDGHLREYPRVAGVSSFGAGGTNAHVIVEEYPQPQRVPPEVGQGCLIVLSARNAERLNTYAVRMLAFVEQREATGDGPALADIAFTLQVGREPMPERLAFVAYSLEDLRGKLQVFLRGQVDGVDLHAANIKQHKDVISAFDDEEAVQDSTTRWVRDGRLDRLLGLWAKGLKVDWERLQEGQHEPGRGPRRIALPTYPFATKRYWLPDVAAAVAVPGAMPQAEEKPRPPLADRPAPGKPTAIGLRNVTSVILASEPITASPPIVLVPLPSPSDTGPHNDKAPPADQQCLAIVLDDLGCGVLSLRPEGVEGQSLAQESACTAMLACIDHVNALATGAGGDDPQARVLLLHGLGHLLAPQECAAATPIIDDVAAAIDSCAVPTVAVMTGDNRYDAIRLALACDVLICAAEGTYELGLPTPPSDAYRILVQRFGEAAVAALQALDGPASGEHLRRAGLTMPVVPEAAIAADALDLARNIARTATATLTALKTQLARSERKRDGCIAGSPAGPAGFDSTTSIAAASSDMPQDIALRSDVVSAACYRNGVVVVRLHDRVSKNTSSPAFVLGVIEAFEHIRATPAYKVVVLTGFDSYFACGGTREGLLAIQSGAARFTDEQSYALPLLCEIPVIAAMQGHAIGAGWAMGLFCDWAIYSEESVYQSPYMLYGFTPGAGSTLIFPERLGRDLSREILLSAREYRGRDLQRRGLAASVVPRRQVPARALALANHLASSPREHLIEEKARRSAHLRARLPTVFAEELALHDTTFVGNAAVIEKIAQHFNAITEAEESSRVESHDGQPRRLALAVQDPAERHAWLLRSLADELSLEADEIDADVAFIDLGMDSISAVTWVRKVNRQFGVNLPATLVYRHPTLAQFAAFVLPSLDAVSDRIGDQKMRPQDVTGAQPPHGGDGGAVDRTSASVFSWLRESVARELLLSADSVDEETKFVDMGLDSVTAVTWIRAVNKRYGLSISATRVYSHPTLAAFHRHLSDMLEAEAKSSVMAGAHSTAQSESARDAPDLAPAKFPAPSPILRLALATDLRPTAPVARAQAVEVVPITPRTQEDVHGRAATQAPPAIAIIGMAGQFPQAKDVTAFWRNILAGRECVSEIPPARWSIEDYYDPDRSAPGKTVCRRMGALDDVDVFDPLFFGISPAEAELMDPQQRLFIQNSWRCIEDAGYDPGTLAGSLCGVFVGCAASDYHQLMARQPHTAQGLIGESVAMLPARIAYFLDLQGPCLSIDTACSASLVALASACDSLVLGNSDLALAGGVYVINGPDIHVKMSKAGMLSPNGRCFTFDQRADGFVPGEGVGVLLLKRLDDAKRDGDDIYAIVRGWGVNQDGKTNGITAPNQDSQMRLETGVYEKFRIDPDEIGLVEAHGTGTSLGDPIEVEALSASFRRFTARRQFCALGSVKSNIGHLATAAGVAGVIKATLALRNALLPPTINYERLNTHIELDDSPFYVNTGRKPWPAVLGRKRLVAVSSFGFSGTNAHVVLEECTSDAEPALLTRCDGDVPVLLPLSARNPEQLRQYAQVVCDFLSGETEGEPIELVDLAYTFQIGRAALACRLAIVASTPDALRQKLSHYASTGETDEDCFAAMPGSMRIKDGIYANPVAASNATHLSPDQLRTAGRAWVAGAPTDWTSINNRRSRRRHGLPTYPFAHEHYWVPQPEADDSEAAAPASSAPRAVDESSPSCAPSLWLPSSLPDNVDWKGRLRDKLAGRVLIAYADEGLHHAIVRLLSQLKRACGLEGSPDPAFCPIGEISTALAVPGPECILFLGGTGARVHDEQIAHSLHALAGHLGDRAADLFMFVFAGRSAADRLGERLAQQVARGRQRVVLLTQEDGPDFDMSIQRLLREWLADAEPTGPSAGLKQIHYSDEQRRTRQHDGVSRSVESHANDPWLIRKDWQARPAQIPATSSRRGSVLVLVDHGSLHLARTLIEPGEFRRIVRVGNAGIAPDDVDHIIDFAEARSARASAELLIQGHHDVTHLIDLSDLAETPKGLDSAHPGRVSLYQALVGASSDLSILHVTMGLQPFRTGRMSLAGAKFAGLVKMLGAEYRHVVARTIDIDDAAFDDNALLSKILLEEFHSSPQETELCYRAGQRFAPVLSTAPLVDGAEKGDGLKVRQDGVYVISGGTNGVGLEIAKHLTRKGCRKLVLLGITPLPPKPEWPQAVDCTDVGPDIRRKLRALLELEKSVDRLEIYTGSLARPEPLQRYFRKIRSDLGAISGVVHSAGVSSDTDSPGFISKNLEGMQKVWTPKADGLATLHAVLEADTLDFFVAFSSMAALVPSLARGASDYAMANSFVESFFAYQHHQNGRLHDRNILWPDWNQTGTISRISAEKVARVERAFDRVGLRTFSNAEGCRLFELALTRGSGSRAAMGIGCRQSFEQNLPRLLHADLSLGESEPAPVVADPAPTSPDAPAARTVPILRHIERWEREKGSGAEVSISHVTDVISLDAIRRLEPHLIHRIHQLLFGAAAPASQTRADLASLIADTVMEVLKLKSIDPAASFQSYGLDSISATVLATRVEKKLNRPVQPRWLIEHCTVEALSRHLSVRDESSRLNDAVPLNIAS